MKFPAADEGPADAERDWEREACCDWDGRTRRREGLRVCYEAVGRRSVNSDVGESEASGESDRGGRRKEGRERRKRTHTSRLDLLPLPLPVLHTVLCAEFLRSGPEDGGGTGGIFVCVQGKLHERVSQGREGRVAEGRDEREAEGERGLTRFLCVERGKRRVSIGGGGGNLASPKPLAK